MPLFAVQYALITYTSLYTIGPILISEVSIIEHRRMIMFYTTCYY